MRRPSLFDGRQRHDRRRHRSAGQRLGGRRRVRLPEGVRIEVADVGAPPPNLAVVGARRAGDRVIATVRNAAGEARDARVRLTVDGESRGRSARARRSRSDRRGGAAGGGRRDASIAVDDSDGCQGGQRVVPGARGGQPSRRPGRHQHWRSRSRRVLPAPRDCGRRAEAARRYEVEGLATSRCRRADGSPALDRFAAVVLLSTRGLESRGREAARRVRASGGGVLMAFGPQVDPEVASGIVRRHAARWPHQKVPGARAGRSLAPGDIRHPVIEPFSGRAAGLGLATFRRIGSIERPAATCSHDSRPAKPRWSIARTAADA